ncbi:hypothetical protein M885DRAFT_526800 [Pelagophyceae sp. CCMP2097]|nr:hypothetical protein M885DRAFT_526800 [Pelagophyceae sp. CCMP2097]
MASPGGGPAGGAGAEAQALVVVDQSSPAVRFLWHAVLDTVRAGDGGSLREADVEARVLQLCDDGPLARELREQGGGAPGGLRCDALQWKDVSAVLGVMRALGVLRVLPEPAADAHAAAWRAADVGRLADHADRLAPIVAEAKVAASASSPGHKEAKLAAKAAQAKALSSPQAKVLSSPRAEPLEAAARAEPRVDAPRVDVARDRAPSAADKVLIAAPTVAPADNARAVAAPIDARPAGAACAALAGAVPLEAQALAEKCEFEEITRRWGAPTARAAQTWLWNVSQTLPFTDRVFELAKEGRFGEIEHSGDAVFETLLSWCWQKSTEWDALRRARAADLDARQLRTIAHALAQLHPETTRAALRESRGLVSRGVCAVAQEALGAAPKSAAAAGAAAARSRPPGDDDDDALAVDSESSDDDEDPTERSAAAAKRLNAFDREAWLGLRRAAARTPAALHAATVEQWFSELSARDAELAATESARPARDAAAPDHRKRRRRRFFEGDDGDEDDDDDEDDADDDDEDRASPAPPRPDGAFARRGAPSARVAVDEARVASLSGAPAALAGVSAAQAALDAALQRERDALKALCARHGIAVEAARRPAAAQRGGRGDRGAAALAAARGRPRKRPAPAPPAMHYHQIRRTKFANAHCEGHTLSLSEAPPSLVEAIASIVHSAVPALSDELKPEDYLPSDDEDAEPANGNEAKAEPADDSVREARRAASKRRRLVEDELVAPCLEGFSAATYAARARHERAATADERPQRASRGASLQSQRKMSVADSKRSVHDVQPMAPLYMPACEALTDALAERSKSPDPRLGAYYYNQASAAEDAWPGSPVRRPPQGAFSPRTGGGAGRSFPPPAPATRRALPSATSLELQSAAIAWDDIITSVESSFPLEGSAGLTSPLLSPANGARSPHTRRPPRALLDVPMPDLEPLELPAGVQLPLVDRAPAQRRNRPRPAPLVIEDGAAPSRSASASSLAAPSRNASASSLCVSRNASASSLYVPRSASASSLGVLPAQPILAPKVARLAAAYDDGGSSSDGDSSSDDLDEAKMLSQHDSVLKEMKFRIDKLVDDAKKAHVAGASPRRVPPSPAPRAQQPLRKTTPRATPKANKPR